MPGHSCARSTAAGAKTPATAPLTSPRDRRTALVYAPHHPERAFLKVHHDHGVGSGKSLASAPEPTAQWPTIFPTASSTAALIGRVGDHADIVAIEGDSFRRREAEGRESAAPPAPSTPRPASSGPSRFTRFSTADNTPGQFEQQHATQRCGLERRKNFDDHDHGASDESGALAAPPSHDSAPSSGRSKRSESREPDRNHSPRIRAQPRGVES